MDSLTISVTGANGFLGRHVTQAAIMRFCRFDDHHFAEETGATLIEMEMDFIQEASDYQSAQISADYFGKAPEGYIPCKIWFFTRSHYISLKCIKSMRLLGS